MLYKNKKPLIKLARTVILEIIECVLITCPLISIGISKSGIKKIITTKATITTILNIEKNQNKSKMAFKKFSFFIKNRFVKITNILKLLINNNFLSKNNYKLVDFIKICFSTFALQ